MCIRDRDINLRTDRTNCTTSGREESTPWKVGGGEMWFGGETDHRHCTRESTLIVERGKRERSTQGIPQGKHFPKAIDWENKRG